MADVGRLVEASVDDTVLGHAAISAVSVAVSSVFEGWSWLLGAYSVVHKALAPWHNVCLTGCVADGVCWRCGPDPAFACLCIYPGSVYVCTHQYLLHGMLMLESSSRFAHT